MIVMFFFFKQKTAYDMRISDWSSDVCSSDLLLNHHSNRPNPLGETFNYADAFKRLDYHALKRDIRAVLTDSQAWWPADWGSRSEERRVGKECVSQCRARG